MLHVLQMHGGRVRHNLPRAAFEEAPEVREPHVVQHLSDYRIRELLEVAGLGEDEALARAHAYEQAGADMILIHSKRKDPGEIESFSKAWNGAAPLVIVPNAYPELNAADIRVLGNIRMIIYGNYAIRAAATAMKETFLRVIADGGVQQVHRDLLPVEDVFHLQGMESVRSDERRYLR